MKSEIWFTTIATEFATTTNQLGSICGPMMGCGISVEGQSAVKKLSAQQWTPL